MTLIKSISGIRGTIGGTTNDNLTPIDAVKFAAAYGTWLKNYAGKEELTVVIGQIHPLVRLHYGKLALYVRPPIVFALHV